MKPKLILCLALVLSGAILNLLVAWSCILWSPAVHSTSPPTTGNGIEPKETIGPDDMSGHWGKASGFGVRLEFLVKSYGHSEEEIMSFSDWVNAGTPMFYQSGWPMVSMQSVVNALPDRTHKDQELNLTKWDLPREEILHRGLQTSWLPTWLHVQQERRLVIVPLWLGFAVDTLLYSVVLLGIYFLLCRIWKRKPKLS